MPWAQQMPTLEESESFSTMHRCKFLAREELVLLLFLKGKNTIVGSSGLHRIDWNIPKFEIGYWCRKRFRGKAISLNQRRQSRSLRLRTLGEAGGIRCDLKNVRSQRIPNRLGFRWEGTLRNIRFRHQENCRIHSYLRK